MKAYYNSAHDAIPADMAAWYGALYADGLAAGHLIEHRFFTERDGLGRTFSTTLENAARAAL